MIDLAIIGGGPAGYVAAERAAEHGLSVVLFEKRDLGGVCLNEGCIPTKTLLYSAKIYDSARASDKYGISVEGATFDYKKISDRKNKVVRKLVAGIGIKMKNGNVTVVKSEVSIKDRNANGEFTLKVAAEHNAAGEQGATGESYLAKNLLVCTGSQAFVPPIPGLAEAGETVMTNREILALKELPSSLVIIGGGVIGVEFASLYNSFGVEVTVIEMLPEILTGMDTELASMLRAQYEKRGVKFMLGCKVERIDNQIVTYTNSEGEQSQAIGEKILVSVGRRPVVSGFGLEGLGVELHKGGIKVDDQMRTNIPRLYAAGDVTGFSLLAHTASREAEVAVNTIVGKPDLMSYRAIPAIVYTNPEIAGVGLTPEAATEKGIPHKVLALPMAYSGRFVAENEGVNGMCKVVVAEDCNRVLGVHMLGNPASEIIFGAAMAIEQEMTTQQLAKIVFPHPTVSEIIKETVSK